MLCRHFRHQVLSGVTLLQASTASFSTAVLKLVSSLLYSLGTVSDIKVLQNKQVLPSSVTLSYVVTTDSEKTLIAYIRLKGNVENGIFRSALSTLSGVSITGVSGFTTIGLSPTFSLTSAPTNLRFESNLGLGSRSEEQGNGTEDFYRERDEFHSAAILLILYFPLHSRFRYVCWNYSWKYCGNSCSYYNRTMVL